MFITPEEFEGIRLQQKH